MRTRRTRIERKNRETIEPLYAREINRGNGGNGGNYTFYSVEPRRVTRLPLTPDKTQREVTVRESGTKREEHPNHDASRRFDDSTFPLGLLFNSALAVARAGLYWCRAGSANPPKFLNLRGFLPTHTPGKVGIPGGDRRFPSLSP